MSLRNESKDDLEDHSQERPTKRLKKYLFLDSTFDINYHQPSKYVCNDRWSPCCGLVRLYARMGLHRYNFLKGTNLQLRRVKKYYMSTGSAACSYNITLVAKDPATRKRLCFLTTITEERFCKFILTADVAKPLGTNTDDDDDEPLITDEYFTYLRGSVPKCPPEDLFQNSQRFYVVKESELQQNGWIRLYLELAVATTHTNKGRNHDLSNLKILKVAIETTEDLDPPNEGSLNALTALVYIRYEDSCESRVGKDVDRIAIVKRTFNQRHGCFALKGRNMPFKSDLAHGIQNLRL